MDRGTSRIPAPQPNTPAVSWSTRPVDRRGQDPSRASQHALYASDPMREDDMNSTNDTAVVAGRASGQTTRPHRLRRLVGTGVIATLGATAVTTLAAALAQAGGVDFEVSNDGRPIPLAGFAVMTGFFSVVGIVIAAALRRWSARPSRRFTQTAWSLTAISFVPPSPRQTPPPPPPSSAYTWSPRR